MSAPWNYNLYINGEWTEGEGGGQIDVIDPATEESHRQRRRGVDEGRGAAHRGRPQGVRRGPVAVDEAGRARRPSLIKMARDPRVARRPSSAS